MSGNQGSIEELIDKVNEGYTNLSKWLIALSAGTIVFSVRLIKSDTPEHLNMLLIWGLGSLVLSILAGTIFVRLRFDNLHYNLLELRTKKRLDELKVHNPEEKLKRGKKEITVKNRLQELTRMRNKAERNYDLINIFLVIFFPLQQWTFLLGIILITFFGICNIKLG